MNTRNTLSLLTALIPAAAIASDDTQQAPGSRPLAADVAPSKIVNGTKAVPADVAGTVVTADTASTADPLVKNYANCDGSTTFPVINAVDFICFLNHASLGSAYANCDGSTGTPRITANDFVCFLNAFNQAQALQAALHVVPPNVIH